jgi:hypothetical protein
MDLETSFAYMPRRTSRTTGLMEWLSDALIVAQDDEARLGRERHLSLAQDRLRRAPRSLAGAAARMDDVALDTAWRAALRGDSAVVEARVLPLVRPALKRARAGTPWRASGWLTGKGRAG